MFNLITILTKMSVHWGRRIDLLEVRLGTPTRRMPAKCRQDPNFFRSSLRSGLKQRQEVRVPKRKRNECCFRN